MAATKRIKLPEFLALLEQRPGQWVLYRDNQERDSAQQQAYLLKQRMLRAGATGIETEWGKFGHPTQFSIYARLGKGN